MAAVFYDASNILTATVVMPDGSECTSTANHGIPTLSETVSNRDIAAYKNVIYKCGGPAPSPGNN